MIAVNVEKHYVNKIIHRFKNGKMLINLWIMWITVILRGLLQHLQCLPRP